RTGVGRRRAKEGRRSPRPTRIVPFPVDTPRGPVHIIAPLRYHKPQRSTTERFMAPRFRVAIGFLSILAVPGTSRGDGPPRRAENVVVVTLDGFRHQEFFAGADETLIDARAGGVPDVDDLRRRYWRGSAEERREVLLPF